MLFRGSRGAALSNPLLERCVIFIVRYFYHSYLMPPFSHLGTSGFLSCSSLGRGRCTSNGSCHMCVFVRTAQWGVMLNQIAGIRLWQAPSFNTGATSITSMGRGGGFDLCQTISMVGLTSLARFQVLGVVPPPKREGRGTGASTDSSLRGRGPTPCGILLVIQGRFC